MFPGDGLSKCCRIRDETGSKDTIKEENCPHSIELSLMNSQYFAREQVSAVKKKK